MRHHAKAVYRLIVEVAIALVLYCVLRPLDISHDAAINLNIGQMLIDGKLPYVDIMDTNPPLVMYLHAIPALVARWVPLHVILVYSLMVLAVAVYSVWAVRRVMAVSGLDDSEEDLAILLLSWLVFTLALRVLNVYLFGQREHLLVLAYLPFLVMRWVRWEGGFVRRPMAIVVGVVAAMGACIKPHFVLLAVLPEMYWVVAKRAWRPLVRIETLAFVLTGLLYVTHFLLLPAQVQEALWNRWLPAMVSHYDAYNVSLRHLLASPDIQFACAMILAPFVLPAFRKSGLGRLAGPMAFMTLGAVFFFVLQHKGWSYHALPASAGAFLLLVLAILHLRRLAPWSSAILAAAGLATLAFLVALGHLHWSAAPVIVGWLVIAGLLPLLQGRSVPWTAPVWMSRLLAVLPHAVLAVIVARAVAVRVSKGAEYVFEGNPIAAAVARYTSEGDPVLFISTSVEPAYPLLVQMNRRPASRYLWSFMVPMFYKGVHPGADGQFPYHVTNTPPEEARYLRELADDIAASRPALIVIVEGPWQASPPGFDLVQYLGKTGFAKTAMKDYVALPERAWDTRIFVPKEAMRGRP